MDGKDEWKGKKCVGCGTELEYAPGIGPYCPNKNCDRIDDQTEECPHKRITHFHDNSILCLDCNEVIWQGKTMTEACPEEYLERLERADGLYDLDTEEIEDVKAGLRDIEDGRYTTLPAGESFEKSFDKMAAELDKAEEWYVRNGYDRKKEVASSAAHMVVFDAVSYYSEHLGLEELTELDLGIIYGAVLEKLGHYLRGHAIEAAKKVDHAK
jgi:hypothetical protein